MLARHLTLQDCMNSEMWRIAIFPLLLVFAGCAFASKDPLSHWRSLDDFERNWFSKNLIAAGEKSIELPASTPVYRFMLLPSFFHTIIIKVECPDNCSLETIELSGNGGYEPGKVLTKNRRTLTGEEQHKFSTLFAAIHFWAPESEQKILGLDGSEWILEAAQGNTYQAWAVWEPSIQPGFAAYSKFCKYLLSLSDSNEK